MTDLFLTANVSPKRRQVILVARAVAYVNLFFVTHKEARTLRLEVFPTRSQANNNPGLIDQWGSYPKQNGIVRFPTAALGVRALTDMVAQAIHARQASMLSLFQGHGASGDRPAFRGLNPGVNEKAALLQAQALLAALEQDGLVVNGADVCTPLFLVLTQGQ